MSVFAKVTNGVVEQYPVDLRAAFPDTSFPADLSHLQFVPPDGYVRVWDTIPQTPNGKQAQLAGIEFADGIWRQKWEYVDVPQRTRLTRLQFISRLTDAEFQSILLMAKTNVQIEAWLYKFNAATPEPDGTSVDLADARTIAGVNALEASGILAPGRAAEILTV